jgi:hypothetical protein
MGKRESKRRWRRYWMSSELNGDGGRNASSQVKSRQSGDVIKREKGSGEIGGPEGFIGALGVGKALGF